MKRSEISVLVVEDETSLVNVISSILKITGIKNIDQAINGKNACQLISQTPRKTYHLMIFDTDCPVKGDGPRILEYARSLDHNPELIIASSGQEDNKKLWSGKSEANYFLLKPYSILELKKIIESHFPK